MKTRSLIIGGSRGLGREIARLMLARGDLVTIVARRMPDPASILDDATYELADITTPEMRREAFQNILAKNSPLTNLVFAHRFRAEGDPWQGEILSSVTSTRHAIEELAPAIQGDERGSIVLISSVAAERVVDDQPVGYHVAKAAIEQMVRFYAVKLGNRGIRVNGVVPFTFIKEESRAHYASDPARLEMYRRIVPLGRLGTAEDVARVILFLCSPDARFVTGQNLVVDGGLSARWPEAVAQQLLRPPEKSSPNAAGP